MAKSNTARKVSKRPAEFFTVNRREVIYQLTILMWSVLLILVGLLTLNANLLLALIIWAAIGFPMHTGEIRPSWSHSPIGKWIYEFFEQPRIRNLVVFTLAVAILGYGPYVPYDKFTYTVQTRDGDFVKTVHADEYGYHIPLIQNVYFWNEVPRYSRDYQPLLLPLADGARVYVDFDIKLQMTGDPEATVELMHKNYESPEGYQGTYETAIVHQLQDLFATLTLNDMGSPNLSARVKAALNLERYNLEVTEAAVKSIRIDLE